MKICVVHQYYLMPGQSGGSRFNEMARLWSEAGHEVTVIAGTVDYSTGRVPERYRRRLHTVELDRDVKIVRCWVPELYASGYVGRAFAFLAFQFSAALATFRLARPDVVIATSPPLVAIVPGWICARWRVPRIPWIFEIRDLWPESAVSTGVLRERSLLTRALYALEAWGYRTSQHITVLTPAFTDDIVGRGLAAREKISLVPNGADIEAFQPGPRENSKRRDLGWGDRFVVIYAGAHGRANALSQLIDAAEKLANRPDILIACVGDGPERAALDEEVRKKSLKNIVFHGPQSKQDMPAIVQAADVGAAVLQANETFKTVYPNKVFDYMACARPTLIAIDGVARELVCDRARAGVFASPEDGGDIARVIRMLADDREVCRALGERGRQYVLQHQSRPVLAERYLEILARLAGESGDGAVRDTR